MITENPSRSVKTSLHLAHRAGEWAGLAMAAGWPRPQYVLPQTWRAAYRRKRVRGASRWTKADAIRWATTLYPIQLTDRQHDLAEALLIARWAAVRAYGDQLQEEDER